VWPDVYKRGAMRGVNPEGEVGNEENKRQGYYQYGKQKGR